MAFPPQLDTTTLAASSHGQQHRAIRADAGVSAAKVEVQADGAVRLGDSAGGDYTEVEPDGTIKFVGDATVWRDENVSGENLGVGATPPTIAAFVGGIRAFQFAGGTSGTDDELHGSLELNHDYKAGTDIVFHVHFAPMVAVSSANGGVTWAVEYTWANDGDVHGAATSADATYSMPNPTAAFKQLRQDVVTISGAGKTIGSVLAFRIFRNRVAANTYADLVALLSVGIHYEVDTIGSRQITTK
jgi:hypothetical protein